MRIFHVYGDSVERVWVTRYGSRYHAERNCRALADGHAKAASESFANHPAQLRALDQVGEDISPCSRCWPTHSEWDEWKQLEHETVRRGDSTFEYEFLHRVLKHVKGIEPYYVSFQHEVTGSAGRNFRVDFALLPPGGRKIAIEVDGFDKTARGSVATKEHQDKDSARRNELHIAGWELLSFTNRQVQTASGECRREIESLLRSQPSRAAREAAAPIASVASLTTPSPERESTSPTLEPAASPSVFLQPPQRQPERSRAGWWAAGVAVAALVVASLFWSHGGNERAASSVPNGPDCAAGTPVKGNISDSGSKIYHLPGWRFYDNTWPEECFRSAADAESAGFRASKVQ